MNKFKTITLLLSLLFWIASNTLWIFLGSKLYYLGIAQFVLISTLIIHSFSNGRFDGFITRCAAFVACNHLLDELFFDPTTFELYEYVSFITFIAYSYIKSYHPKVMNKVINLMKTIQKKWRK